MDVVVFISLHLIILHKNYQLAGEKLTWKGVLRFALGSSLFIAPSTFIIFWIWAEHSFIPYSLWTPVLFIFITYFLNPLSRESNAIEENPEENPIIEEPLFTENTDMSHSEVTPISEENEVLLLYAL